MKKERCRERDKAKEEREREAKGGKGGRIKSHRRVEKGTALSSDQLLCQVVLMPRRLSQAMPDQSKAWDW